MLSKLRRSVAVLGLVLSAGCAGLLPKATPPPQLYALDSADRERGLATAAPSAKALATLTFVVNPTRAAAGFDSQHIVYERIPHQRAHFAHSDWVDTPARMLGPLVVAAVARSGAFRAVSPSASAAVGDLRLDTEIMRLQHEFGGQPSRVRFTLRAYIVDSATGRVVASHEFDETALAVSEDPYGGVIAANTVVATVMQQLTGFCAEAARTSRTRD